MLGESAGRSPQHRERGTARRRFTIDERAANTPLPDDVQEWPDEPRTRSRMRQHVGDIVWATIATGITLGCITMYNTYADWRGGVSLAALGAMVAALAIYARNH